MEGFSLGQKTIPLHPHGFNLASKSGFRAESTYNAPQISDPYSVIAIGLSDAALEIVRDDQLRDTGKELEGAHMGADPIVELLCESGLHECVVGGAEDGHEDLRLDYFPGGRIDDRDGLSGLLFGKKPNCNLALVDIRFWRLTRLERFRAACTVPFACWPNRK
jgi:hypothetical protein